VLALQHSGDGFDVQTAYFNRTSIVHFMPDPVGDLVFNGVASDVYRQSVVNGFRPTPPIASPTRIPARGFSVSAEQTLVNNSSLLLPLDSLGQPLDAPFNVFDSSSKTGFLFGTYLQDEWKITNQLT